MGTVEVIEVKYTGDATGLKAATKEANAALNGLKKQVQQTKTVLSILQQAFLGFGLSALFIGMNIQKIFLGIARSTTDAFLKIRESAGPTNDAITIMGAAFEFLKYSVGDAIATALEPFLPMILDIIESVSDWVQQNDELTAGLVLGGIALGTFMMALGNLMIPFATIAAMLKTFIGGAEGLAGLTAALKAVSFASLVTGLMNIIFWAALVGIAILALKTAWDTNFSDIRGFIDDTYNSLIIFLDQFKKSFEEFTKGLKLVFEGIFTGDTSKVKDGMARMLRSVIELILVAIGIIGKLAIQFTIFLFKAMFQIASTAIKLIGELVTDVIVSSINNAIDVVSHLLEIIISAGQALAQLTANSELYENLEDAKILLSSFKEGIKISPIESKNAKDRFDNAITGATGEFLGIFDSLENLTLSTLNLKDMSGYMQNMNSILDTYLPIVAEKATETANTRTSSFDNPAYTVYMNNQFPSVKTGEDAREVTTTISEGLVDLSVRSKGITIGGD